MKKQQYFTKNIDNKLEVIDEDIVNDVIRQYIERRYIGVIMLAPFIVGFLLGVIAS
jgi:hypothetical protein